jgi:hypothetical protein
MIAVDPRPMSSAPVDGTPVRLFGFTGSVIASFWTEERCREVFGAGDYRAGWYLFDDDVIEFDEVVGWEPLIHACARSENETNVSEPGASLALNAHGGQESNQRA